MHSEAKAFLVLILFVLLVVFVMYQLILGTKINQLEEWNKKNKKKFKNVQDFIAYQEKLDIKKKEKDYRDALRDEKKSQKKIHKPIQETQIETSEPSGSDIGARLKKLRQMYKDGILSKVEFEKAKNKLLK